MKTISLKSTLAVFFQWVGTFLAFMFSMIAANIISPLPQFSVEQMPQSGFMSQGAAMLFNGALNAIILLWAEVCFSSRQFFSRGAEVVVAHLPSKWTRIRSTTGM